MVYWTRQKECRIGLSKFDGRSTLQYECLYVPGILYSPLTDMSYFHHRDLHKIPELGFEELKTGQYVRWGVQPLIMLVV